MQLAIGLAALFALAVLTVSACHLHAKIAPEPTTEALWDAGSESDGGAAKGKKGAAWVAIAASCGGCGGCGCGG
ncbi:MAG: hypothetical protein ACRDUB_04315 [Mycobacterium sp.]